MNILTELIIRYIVYLDISPYETATLVYPDMSGYKNDIVDDCLHYV